MRKGGCCRDMATLGFAKQNQNNSKLFNRTGSDKQFAVISITEKTMIQMLIGNYKTIEDSLPDDSVIVDMQVNDGPAGKSIYVLAQSSHFRVVEHGEKYPVLGLLYKRTE